jgi:hypothetical protein
VDVNGLIDTCMSYYWSDSSWDHFMRLMWFPNHIRQLFQLARSFPPTSTTLVQSSPSLLVSPPQLQPQPQPDILSSAPLMIHDPHEIDPIFGDSRYWAYDSSSFGYEGIRLFAGFISQSSAFNNKAGGESARVYIEDIFHRFMEYYTGVSPNAILLTIHIHYYRGRDDQIELHWRWNDERVMVIATRPHDHDSLLYQKIRSPLIHVPRSRGTTAHPFSQLEICRMKDDDGDLFLIDDPPLSARSRARLDHQQSIVNTNTTPVVATTASVPSTILQPLRLPAAHPSWV